MTGVWEILFQRHLVSPSRCHSALWVFNLLQGLKELAEVSADEKAQRRRF